MSKVDSFKNIKIAALGIVTAITCISINFISPIAQNPSYHHFADRRTVFGIPNFFNVITNLPFIIIGICGFFLLRKIVVRSWFIIAVTVSAGIWLTGIGSACYHYHPANSTLVYDRLPMTIIFTSFLCLVIEENISWRLGVVLLLPLLFCGVFSVCWWQYTENLGKGDLRFYGLVQFYTPLLILLILLLFPAPDNKKKLKLFLVMILWYGFAKVCEVYDEKFFSIYQLLSGHSLKHLFSALALWQMVRWMKITNQNNLIYANTVSGIKQHSSAFRRVD